MSKPLARLTIHNHGTIVVIVKTKVGVETEVDVPVDTKVDTAVQATASIGFLWWQALLLAVVAGALGAGFGIWVKG